MRSIKRTRALFLFIPFLLLAAVDSNDDLYVQDGLIEPFDSVEIGAPVDGLIDTMAVDRGDQVMPGQVLAQLESSLERAQAKIAAARAASTSEEAVAQTRLELAKQRFKRFDGLYREKVVSLDDWEEADAERRLAEHALTRAGENRVMNELELERANAVLGMRTIRSPIQGVVTERVLSPGEVVYRTNQKPIFRLAQIDPLRVEVIAPIELLGKVKVGDTAEILPQAPAGGSYSAKVTVVDTVIDAASGTFGIRLELPNPELTIPAGLQCRVRFGH